jgi:hypothetical protein
MDEIIFPGPPLRLAPQDELIAEICGRGPAMVFYRADGDEDTGEINFLNRHSFDDVGELARLLRLAADALEGREQETTVAPFA